MLHRILSSKGLWDLTLFVCFFLKTDKTLQKITDWCTCLLQDFQNRIHCSLETGKNRCQRTSCFCRERKAVLADWQLMAPSVSVSLPGLSNPSSSFARFTTLFHCHSTPSHSKKPPHVEDCVVKTAKPSSTQASIQALLWMDELQEALPPKKQGEAEYVPQKLFWAVFHFCSSFL